MSVLINSDSERWECLVGRSSPVPSLRQGSTEGSAIKDHVLKHSLPLVGHRKTSNDAKRYTRRPLVVVYYSVDFGFDYRAGEGPPGPVSRVGHWESCPQTLVVWWLGVFFIYASGSFSICAV